MSVVTGGLYFLLLKAELSERCTTSMAAHHTQSLCTELKTGMSMRDKNRGYGGDPQHPEQGEEVPCKHACVISGRVKAQAHLGIISLFPSKQILRQMYQGLEFPPYGSLHNTRNQIDRETKGKSYLRINEDPDDERQTAR